MTPDAQYIAPPTAGAIHRHAGYEARTRFGHLLTLTCPPGGPHRRAFDERVLTPFSRQERRKFNDEVLVPSAAYTLATLEPRWSPQATPLELLRLYLTPQLKPAAMTCARGHGRETASLLPPRARLRHCCRRACTLSARALSSQFITAFRGRRVSQRALRAGLASATRPLRRSRDLQSPSRKVLLYHAMVHERSSFPTRLPRSMGVVWTQPPHSRDWQGRIDLRIME